MRKNCGRNKERKKRAIEFDKYIEKNTSEVRGISQAYNQIKSFNSIEFSQHNNEI
jgi:hypothetical protein